MVQFKCKMCGGTINVEEGKSTCECEFCGTIQTVPNVIDNNKMAVLHNRANSLRLKNEFDKALANYENIIIDNPNDAEAHWGALLCRYGIEYVDDPKTGLKIPTCHRTQTKSIFDDIDYKAAIDNSDVIAKSLYQKEAEQINNIQKSILSISVNEKPYDIFICYKETDEYGNRTKDSVIAQDLYDELTRKGYKVFFSRITLEAKLGSQYEPYIFAALNSSKVMLVIGTKPEYFNAVWVKNEWARFLSLMDDANGKKYIIPCYRDMDAYELPDELLSFQAQDMGKIGFVQDLLRGIDKLFDRRTVVSEQKPTYTTAPSVNVAALLKRCELLISDKNYNKASELLDDVLNNDPENAKAYALLATIDLGYEKESDLEKSSTPLTNNNNYRYALKFADDAYRMQLEKYNDVILKRIKYNQDLAVYQNAIASKNAGKYAQAISYFNTILDFKDSKAQIDDCNRIVYEIKDQKYTAACKLVSDFKFLDAMKLFDEVIDFKDSREQRRNAVELFEKEKVYIKAKKLEEADRIPSYSKAIEYLNTILDFRDSEKLVKFYQKRIEEINKELEIERQKRRKRNKIVAIVSLSLIALVLLTYFLFIPGTKYLIASNKLKNGNYEEAEEIFSSISTFSDSKKKIALGQAAAAFEEENYSEAFEEIEKADGSIIVSFDTCGSYKIETINCTSESQFNNAFKNFATKKGYEFKGWKVKLDDVQTSNRTINVTFEAMYTAIIYHINYNLDGGVNNSNNIDEYTIEEEIAIQAPTKKGYTFTGWTSLSILTPQLNVKIEKGSTEDITYNANWQANDYTLTYNPNGGNISSNSVNVTYDEWFETIKPTREGYEFGGWYCESEQVVAGKWQYDSDVVVVARWTTAEFLINYNLVGGTNSPSNPSKYTIDDALTIAIPTKTGYTFTGWTTSNNSTPTINVEIQKGTTGDITYIANWVANTYTVNFDTNVETQRTMEEGPIIQNAVLVNAAGDVLSHFDLSKLSVFSLNDAKRNLIEKSILLNDAKSTLENILSENCITSREKNLANCLSLLVFDGETYTPSDFKIVELFYLNVTDEVYGTLSSGGKITLSFDYVGNNKLVVLYKDEATWSWHFAGNYTFFEGSVEVDFWGIGPIVAFLQIEDIVNSNYKYIVGDNGNLYENGVDTGINEMIQQNGKQNLNANDITVTYDQYCTLPLLSRRGYIFDGWYNGDQKIESGIWKYLSNTNLVAKWETISYRIDYDLDGGENNSKNRGHYTIEDYFVVKAPTREGYTFTGWTSSNCDGLQTAISISKGTTGNIKLTANWSPNTYKCNLDVNTGDTLDNTNYSFTFDSAYSLPEPTKLGYIFTGWYDAESKVTSATWKISKNVTLIANWTPRNDIQYIVNHYQQNLDNNDYTLFETVDLVGTADSNIIVETKTYCGFTSPEQVNKTISADGTLVVDYYYTRNSYSISFVCNGGTTVSTVELKFDAPLSDYITERGNSTFGGWFADADLSSLANTVDANVVESCTLYAWWSEETKAASFEYELVGETCSITQFKGKETSVVVPMYINDVLVTKITNLSSNIILDMTLPNSITEVEEGALICGNLSKLTVPFVGGRRYTSSDTICYPLGYMFGETMFSGATATSQRYYGGASSGITYYIPSSLSKVTVTDSPRINTGAFWNCNSLTKIEISNSTTYIASGSFGECNSLQTISLPFVGRNSLENNNTYGYPLGDMFGGSNGMIVTQWYNTNAINSHSNFNLPPSLKEVILTGDSNIVCSAFYNCTMLEKVTITGNSRVIGKNAFYNCSNLNAVELPDELETINYRAFYGCSSLNNIDFHMGLVKIDAEAFAGCSSWANVVIPNSVTSIGNNAFADCSSIESISLPFVGNSRQSQSDTKTKPFGVIFDVIDDQTSNYYNARQYYISNENILTDKTYWIPNGLTSVTITDSTYIPDYSFHNCTSIVTIAIENCLAIGRSAFLGCAELKSVSLADTISSIASYAFEDCSKLETIVLPISLKGIDSYLFADCSSLSSVEMFDNLEYIESVAFINCVRLTNVVIPDSVQRISDSVFAGCYSLESITLPFVGDRPREWTDTIKYPFGYIFGSSNYENSDGVTQYYNSGSSSAEQTKYYIPKSLKEVVITGSNCIATGAFLNCSRLSNITIPSSVTYIGEGAFRNCTSLTSIVIPESVTCIQYDAFYNCSSLSSIHVDLNNSKYDSRDDCNAIIETDTNTLVYGFNNTTIPNSVIQIGDYAFSGCVGLTSIEIPDNVISIGKFAFSSCSNLVSIKIPDSTSIGDSAFNGCSIETAIVPAFAVSYIKNSSLNTLEIIGKRINELPLSGCSSLTQIIISSDIAYFNPSLVLSFEDCPNLVLNQYDNGYYLGNSTNPYLVFVKAVDKSIESCIIHDDCKFVLSNAFVGCEELSSLTIGENIGFIGYNAFYSCFSLSYVNIKNLSNWCNVSSFGTYGILGWSRPWPDNPLAIPHRIYVNGAYVTDLVIPNDVTQISTSTFADCSYITSITIPSSVTSIDRSAFAECIGVTTVVLPNSIVYIGESAFYDCNAIEQIYYLGTAEEYAALTNVPSCGTVYYYSETNPIDAGNYWHYVDDVPALW